MYWRDYLDVYAEFWREKEVMAKKEHTRYECKEKILIGDRYLYFVLKSELGFDTYKICLRCKKNWADLIAVFEEKGDIYISSVYGCFLEALEEALDEGFLDEEHPLVKRWVSHANKNQMELF